MTVDFKHFDSEGYFLARNLLDLEKDLKLVKAEYAALLDLLAQQWFDEGKISSLYKDLTFGQRFCQLTADGMDCLSYFDITLPSKTTADTPIHLGPAVFNLLRNPRVLDVIEALIGGEIYSNPVQHIRIKPPQTVVPQLLLNGLTAAVGWHQDMGVVSAEADDTTMISVWIAVMDATTENGCLQVVPGSHKGELVVHCNYDDNKRKYHQINIPDKLVGANHLALPMKAGDVLFFHKKLMHSSLPNTSADIRWSFDLRYNPIGQPSGRAWLPGFIARSKSHPETELTNPATWADRWRQARSQLASGEGMQPSTRWDSSHPLCA
ncbi:MAG TPA: phytanoyl-CoA dioxygenase family protein [Terriglobales bacterium]|nr:phytanoyl-CoA dioxygenase family protein [Terriglobales bacterium]